MRRNSANPSANSKFTTLRDVAGPGVGMGPCPDQFLGDVVGSYTPASGAGGAAISQRIRHVSSQFKRWADSATRTSDPIINDSLELFSGLSVKETKEIARHLSVVDVAESRILCRQGQRCREFTVIVSGQVGISRDNIPVGLLSPGCWFGCLPLLGWAGDNNRLVTASALSDIRVAVANEREFAILTRDFPVVGDRIFQMAYLRLGFIAELKAELDALQPVEHHAEYPIHLLKAAT